MDKARLFPCGHEDYDNCCWIRRGGRDYLEPDCPGYDTAAYDAAVEALVDAARGLMSHRDRINSVPPDSPTALSLAAGSYRWWADLAAALLPFTEGDTDD